MSVLDNVAYGLMVKGVGEGRAACAGARGARPRQARRDGDAAARGALRRAAPARGARPRAGQQAEGAAPRRAARRARPEAPRADAGRAEGAAEAARHHLRLRHPRPGRGAVDGRPRGDLQRGQARPGRHAARRLRAAADPLRRRFRRLLQRARPGVLRALLRHAQHGPACGRKASGSARAASACPTDAGSTGAIRRSRHRGPVSGPDHARQRRRRGHARSTSSFRPSEPAGAARRARDAVLDADARSTRWRTRERRGRSRGRRRRRAAARRPAAPRSPTCFYPPPAALSRSPARAAAPLARRRLCRLAACAARAELLPARRFHRPDRLRADARDLRRASGAGQSRHHPPHRRDGGARHDRRGDHRLPHRLFRRPLRARALEGALLSRRHAAALVELSGPRLCLEADPRQGRHPHLAVRQAAPLLAARRACSRSR